MGELNYKKKQNQNESKPVISDGNFLSQLMVNQLIRSYFLFVLFIGINGFGATFYVLSNNNKGFDEDNADRFEIENFT